MNIQTRPKLGLPDFQGMINFGCEHPMACSGAAKLELTLVSFRRSCSGHIFLYHKASLSGGFMASFQHTHILKTV